MWKGCYILAGVLLLLLAGCVQSQSNDPLQDTGTAVNNMDYDGDGLPNIVDTDDDNDGIPDDKDTDDDNDGIPDDFDNDDDNDHISDEDDQEEEKDYYSAHMEDSVQVQDKHDNSTNDDSSGEVCEVCRCYNQSDSSLQLDCQSLSLGSVPGWFSELEGTDYQIQVDLSYNSITEISQFPIVDVWDLDLSHNSIGKLATGAFSNISKNLLVLDLSNNELVYSSLEKDCFAVFSSSGDMISFQIIQLSLAKNRLHTMRADTFESLESLAHLDLSDNQLGELTEEAATAIGGLHTLEYLIFRNNGLNTLPTGLLAGMKRLISLDLSGNRLKQVPSEVHLATSLSSLAMDTNLLTSLTANSFTGLTNLNNLSVSDNIGLSSIEEGTFHDLPNLRQLRICNNPEFSWISPDAWPKTSVAPFVLEELDLSNNRLEYIISTLLPDFTNWGDIQAIDIQGNPWMCSCHNEWLINTLVPLIQAKSPELAQNILCDGPRDSDVYKQELLVVHELTKTSQLECDTAQFNAWSKTYGLKDSTQTNFGIHSEKGSGTPLVIGILCVLSIAATAALVGALYLQKQKQKINRHRRFIGERGSVSRAEYTYTDNELPAHPSTGVVNSHYRDDEEDESEIQEWPPKTERVKNLVPAGGEVPDSVVVVGGGAAPHSSDRSVQQMHPFGRPAN